MAGPSADPNFERFVAGEKGAGREPNEFEVELARWYYRRRGDSGQRGKVWRNKRVRAESCDEEVVHGM